MSAPLPGAAPEFFFAPAQIDKRNGEGPGVLMEGLCQYRSGDIPGR